MDLLERDGPAGDWRKAAAEWDRRGRPYERARALAGGDRWAQLAALGILDMLARAPPSRALRRQLREVLGRKARFVVQRGDGRTHPIGECAGPRAQRGVFLRKLEVHAAA